MKILLVANTLPPADLSGVGEQVLQLSRALEGRGHDVEILGRGSGGARGPKLLFPLTIVVPFVRAVLRLRPDVVQVHESDGALAALALSTLASMLDPKPVLVALLQVSYRRERQAVRSIRAEGRVLGRPNARELRFRWFKAPIQIVLGCLTTWLADRVLAPSRATALELEEDYGASDVAIVPNATTLRPPADRGRQNDEAPFILFVGRLRVRKGLEVALHALSRLRLSGHQTRFLVVGDGEHRRPLERVAQELDLTQQVEFLGRRPHDEVQALMARARVLVVPSLYEGMPLVVVEAMQSGLAVVASAVSGIPEVVVDGETGWLVPCEDPAALATALGQAMENGAEAQRRGANGRRRLESEFGLERIAQLWERAVESSPT